MKNNFIAILFSLLFVTTGCLEFLFEQILYQYDFANKQKVPTQPPSGLDLLEIKHTDGTKTVGWILRNLKSDSPVIVYFHGNGLNLQGTYSSGGFDNFAKLNSHIVVFDYPKYGLSTGPVNESTIMKASHAVIKHVRQLFPNSPIIIWGRSLGCAPATQIAKYYQGTGPGFVKGLILTSPWDSAWKLVQKITGFSIKSSKGNVKGNTWDTENFAKEVHIPTIIHHGTLDATVDFTLGQDLANNFPAGIATFIPVVGKGHNDVLDFPQWQQIESFIKNLDH